MEIGIGVDIESLDRFRKHTLEDGFVRKCFSEDEIRDMMQSSNAAQTIAGRFCAKEAIIKAFGSCGKKVFFHDITILKNECGAPVPTVKEFEDWMTKISISHNADSVVAISLIIHAQGE